jgi:hypothetical protein
MAFDRTVTAAQQWRQGIPCLLVEGFLVPMPGGRPPDRIRLPVNGARQYETFEAEPMVDWPPTVTYRFVRRADRDR